MPRLTRRCEGYHIQDPTIATQMSATLGFYQGVRPAFCVTLGPTPATPLSPHLEGVYLRVDGPGHSAHPWGEGSEVQQQPGDDEAGVAAGAAGVI